MACSTSDIRPQSTGVVLDAKCNVPFAQNGYLPFLIEDAVNSQKQNPLFLINFSNSNISIQRLVQHLNAKLFLVGSPSEYALNSKYVSSTSSRGQSFA
jgi:hypothetical protein